MTVIRDAADGGKLAPLSPKVRQLGVPKIIEHHFAAIPIKRTLSSILGFLFRETTNCIRAISAPWDLAWTLNPLGFPYILIIGN